MRGEHNEQAGKKAAKKEVEIESFFGNHALFGVVLLRPVHCGRKLEGYAGQKQ
jgi:hypothetical protein